MSTCFIPENPLPLLSKEGRSPKTGPVFLPQNGRLQVTGGEEEYPEVLSEPRLSRLGLGLQNEKESMNKTLLRFQEQSMGGEVEPRRNEQKNFKNE